MRCPVCLGSNLKIIQAPLHPTVWEDIAGYKGDQLRARHGNPTTACPRCERAMQKTYECPDCGISYCTKCIAITVVVPSNS